MCTLFTRNTNRARDTYRFSYRYRTTLFTGNYHLPTTHPFVHLRVASNLERVSLSYVHYIYIYVYIALCYIIYTATYNLIYIYIICLHSQKISQPTGGRYYLYRVLSSKLRSEDFVYPTWAVSHGEAEEGGFLGLVQIASNLLRADAMCTIQIVIVAVTRLYHSRLVRFNLRRDSALLRIVGLAFT